MQAKSDDDFHRGLFIYLNSFILYFAESTKQYK